MEVQQVADHSRSVGDGFQYPQSGLCCKIHMNIDKTPSESPGK